jgi:hypothetical protein
MTCSKRQEVERAQDGRSGEPSADGKPFLKTAQEEVTRQNRSEERFGQKSQHVKTWEREKVYNTLRELEDVLQRGLRAECA